MSALDKSCCCVIAICEQDPLIGRSCFWQVFCSHSQRLCKLLVSFRLGDLWANCGSFCDCGETEGIDIFRVFPILASIEHRTDTFSISDCLNVPSPILRAIEYRLFSMTIFIFDIIVSSNVWNNSNCTRGF